MLSLQPYITRGMNTLKTFWKFLSIGLVLLFSSIIVAAAPSWTRVNYTSSTAFIGIVKINQYNPSFPITVEEGDYIGAFSGSECRMVAQVFSYNGGLYVSSVIQGGDISDMKGSSSEAEEIEFKVWDNSANALVATTVYGTLMTESAGEIFNFEIGKPNTNSKLESLAVTGITVLPTFSATTTKYTVSIPNGGALPIASAYNAVAQDSRAKVSVTPATAFTSGTATSTIVVTAEDGTKTTYTITFTEEACVTAKPVLAQTSYSICKGDAFPTITATGTTIKWYNSEDLTASGSFPITGKSFTPTAAGTYYVTNTNGCENTDYVAVTVTEKSNPVVSITNLNASYCANNAMVTLQGLPIEGTFTIDGKIATQLDPSKIVAGEHTIVYEKTQDGCSAEVSQKVTILEVATPDITAVPTEACGGKAITLSPTKGTWSGEGVDAQGKIFTATTPGLYLLTYTETGANGCIGKAAATITVKAKPVIDLSSVPTEACADEVVALTPTTGTWSGTGVSGTSFSSASSGSFELEFIENVSGCAGSATTTIAVTKPIAPVVSSSTVEKDGTVPVLTAVADGTINWYDTETGASVKVGDSYTPSIVTSAEKTFTFYATNTKNGCESKKVPGTITVTSCATAAPQMPVAQSICEGETPKEFTAVGANIVWYSAITDGKVLGTGASYLPIETVVGTHTYYASQNPSCEGPRASVTLTIREKPAIPLVENVSVCGVENVKPLTANVAANWYSNKNNAALASDVKSFTPQGITATTTYFVNQVVGGCASDFAEVTYAIASKPSKPVVDATEACVGSTADYFVRMSGSIATGATLQWYDEKGVAKGTSSIQDVAVTSAQQYTYTVTQSVGGCESDAASATLTVHALPKLIITVDPSYCSNNNDVVTLSANVSGGDFTIDGMINESFTPSTLGSGQHTAAYTYEDENGCYGEESVVFSINNCSDPAVESITLNKSTLSLTKGDVSTDLVVTIAPSEAPKTVAWTSSNEGVATVDENGIVTAVGAGDAVITATSTYTPSKKIGCAVTVVAPVESVSFNNTADITVGESSTVELAKYLVINPTDASIEKIEWKSSNTNAGTVANGTVTTSSVDANTTVTITVTVTTKDGTSKSAQVAVTIVNGCDMAAPVVQNASQFVCAGSGDEVSFSANGDASANWIWVDASDKTVSSTNSFSTATVGTYYVYQTLGECVSSRTTVSLSEKIAPAAPIVADLAVCKGENGTFSSNVIAVWYSSANEELATGQTYKPTVAGTYYAKQISGGCYSDATEVTYTINALPQYTTTDVTAVKGAVIPELKVTTDNTNTVTWYYNNAEVGSGSSFATGKTEKGTYTYYVTVSNKTTGCTTAKAAVLLQISDCDLVPPTVLNDIVSVCEKDVIPTFTATAENAILWYSDASLSNQVETGATYTPTNATLGTQNFYVVQKGTCQSSAKKVSLTINALPSLSVSVPSPLKTTDAPVVVTVSPYGGKITGKGVSDSKFYPSTGAGEYEITYVYEDINGCTNSKTFTTVVNQAALPDRTQLGDTIARANAIQTQFANSELYTDAAKLTLSQATAVAQDYYDEYVSYTNEELYVQVVALSNAIKTFLASKIPPIDLAPLQEKINEAIAVAAANDNRKGNSVGNIPESSFIALQAAIDAANGVLNNPPSKQSGVTSAVNVLNNAILAFLASEIQNKITGVLFPEDIIYITVGEKLTPELLATPLGASVDNTNFTWTSSNDKVAKVYGSGSIEAIKSGTVSITATYTSDPSVSDRVVVVVSNKPEIVSVEVNRLGNQLYLNFSETMNEPEAQIYSDLYIYGTKIPIYNILDVALWPVDRKRVVVTLGSYIDNPSDISVVYKGSSLSSIYGAKVEAFDYNLGSTAVEDVEELQIAAYPTFATSTITVAGVTPGDEVSIVSAMGKQVATQIASLNTEDIDISRFVSGTYYVLVSDGNSIKAKLAFVKK